MTVAPDLIEKVIGYRSWHVDGERLCAAAVTAEWTPGVNTAACLARGLPPGAPPHKAPASDCYCGLYALHGSGHLLHVPERIIGAVAAWGDIEVHAGGFRAEYAEILALACTARPSYPFELARSIAGRYGVPLVSGEIALERAALRGGQPVPASLRPRPPTRPAIDPAAVAFSNLEKSMAQLRSTFRSRSFQVSMAKLAAAYAAAGAYADCPRPRSRTTRRRRPHGRPRGR